MSSGYGCKEVYRFPHITYPYICTYLLFFAAALLLFVHFFCLEGIHENMHASVVHWLEYMHHF